MAVKNTTNTDINLFKYQRHINNFPILIIFQSIYIKNISRSPLRALKFGMIHMYYEKQRWPPKCKPKI